MPAWHAHPDVWFLIATLAGGYVIAIRVFGARLAPAGPGADPETREPSGWRQVAFFAGIAALWLGADWPVHEIAEGYLFSVHMVQHTLFSLIAPPLLLLGLPKPLLRKLVEPEWAHRAVRFLTRPLVALVLFNGVVVGTHWPVIVDASLRSEPLHFLLHATLFTSAMLMWWPVVDPLPEFKRLSEPGKMFYLFLQSILPTVPASFLTFAQSPIYHFYESAPRLWGIDVLTDQQMAGLIMKIGGGLLLWICIATIYFRWNAQEESAEEPKVSWEDFERELDAWDLRQP